MKKSFFLVSTSVHYLIGGIRRSQDFNVLITNEHPFVTRPMLAQIQQQAHTRFNTENPDAPTSEVFDVFVITVNNLGEMTDEEFHGAFGVPGTEAPVASDPASNDDGSADLPIGEAVDNGTVPAPAPADASDPFLDIPGTSSNG